MSLSIRPLAVALGAEIRGVDIAKAIDEPTFAAIEHAYNEHSVLVFPDQACSEEQHVRFSRRFGELEVHVLAQYLHPQHPEILVVSNIVENGRNIGIADAGRYWHSDLSYMAVPSRGSLLYAREVPHQDGRPLGDTVWTSTAAAYDALPDAMKRRIDGLEAAFSLANRDDKLKKDGNAGTDRSTEQKGKTPEVIHRIVRTHPVTGRKSIYVNEGHTARVVGVPEDESRALLEELCAHCTQPRFQYRHQWRRGDLVMWDNVPTQHIAICDYALPHRRLMHRTTLRGSAPI